MLDLEFGTLQRLSPGYGKATCGWVHPSGTRALFASTHLDPQAREKQRAEMVQRERGSRGSYGWDYDPHFDLFEANLLTGRIQQLTDAFGYDAEASWSPDGARIVFSSNRHAYAGSLPPEEWQAFERDRATALEIYSMDAGGSDIRRLTSAGGADGGPFFSADGRKICWRRFREDGSAAEIFTMNPDGSEPRQLTHLGAVSWAPYFHPSGDYLIFAANARESGDFELYLVDAEGRQSPVRVTDAEGFDGLPVFLPDGQHVAWTSNRTPGGASQIFWARWNDTLARRLLGLAPEPPQADLRLRGKEGGEFGPARLRADIVAEDIRRHVAYLASGALRGRLAGTEGERLAAEYVAERFAFFGLEPAGVSGTYFDEYEFAAAASLGSANRFAVTREGAPREYLVDVQWRPVAYSKIGSVPSARVVFAGYGIYAPESAAVAAYDSFPFQGWTWQGSGCWLFAIFPRA